MTRYLSFRIQLWVVVVAAILMIIGVVVCVNIVANQMSYENAKAAIVVGLIIWGLCGVSIWGCQAANRRLPARPLVEVEIEPAATQEV